MGRPARLGDHPRCARWSVGRPVSSVVNGPTTLDSGRRPGGSWPLGLLQRAVTPTTEISRVPACNNCAVPGIRTVSVTRYVTPLREGGSLPAIVEADDDGLYVLKFRGAGQGAKALIAELVVGGDRACARVAGPGNRARESRRGPGADRARPRDSRAHPRQRRPQPGARLLCPDRSPTTRSSSTLPPISPPASSGSTPTSPTSTGPHGIPTC